MSNSDSLAPITHAKINLDNLSHNFSILKQTARQSKMMAMVKADAYGHGLIPVAKHLVALGVDYLGVAFVEEGVALRKAGITIPILVTTAALSWQYEDFLKHDLEITVSSIAALNELIEISMANNAKAKVQLKIDTGMGRIGVDFQEAPQFISLALRSPWLNVKGIYSHFACADNPATTFTKIQLDRLLDLVNFFKKNYPAEKLLFHIANSASLISYPESHLDMVRPGIMLYGCYPNNNFYKKLNLKAVLSLQTKVVHTKVVPPNTGISYNHSWRSTKETGIATLPIGYGHGYFRNLANQARVLINGKSYALVGNICMDQMMLDCEKDHVKVNDLVTLIGKEGTEEITVENLAKLAGTISYEILTNIPAQVPRIYLVKRA